MYKYYHICTAYKQKLIRTSFLFESVYIVLTVCTSFFGRYVIVAVVKCSKDQIRLLGFMTSLSGQFTTKSIYFL